MSVAAVETLTLQSLSKKSLWDQG